jgi:LysR family transcriptional regulator, glycine cleavage system transcriptional activator
MGSRLPPLNALRAFEAAGRNQSFAKAAEELFVTPGAVSRQIRTLEEFVGFSLFNRNHREVQLTAEANHYLQTVSDAFKQIETATHRLADTRKQRLLHIHAAITFTLRWLLPRLSGFHAKNPDNEIRLSASLPTNAELSVAPTDVTIRIKTEESAAAATPHLITHRLVDIELVPVCSPGYRDSHDLRGAPAVAMRRATLLHSTARPDDWESWLYAAGARDIDPHAGINFASSSLAYQGALEGVGIAIAMRAFVGSDLQAGRLVTPFQLAFNNGEAFYLTYSAAGAQLPQVLDFRDWVMAEALAGSHLQHAA